MAVRRNIDAKRDDLQKKREESRLGGGTRRIEAQHKKGKLTARERIASLLDDGTFEELDSFAVHQSTEFGLDKQRFLGDSVVTGFGTIAGRRIFVYAQDFTVVGGSLSLVAAQKITKVMDLALNTGAPMIGLIDSGGARIQEGIDSLSGYSDIFLRNVRASGVIPQISAVFGPAAGGASYSPALTDFVLMVRGTGQLYITGPDVIKAVTGEEITHEDLGGAETHASKSGVAHFAADSEEECMDQIRRLLSFLPQNNMAEPPPASGADDEDPTDQALADLIPDNPNQAYDMTEIIRRIVDGGEFFQVHEMYARNVVVGYARMDGRTVGIVANQPEVMAGVLDINASAKAARFVRFCDAFNIPIVTLIDVPGFMPGSAQEHSGIIRHGAKLIYAYAEATVPKISVLTRKAYGGAYIVMSSKGLKGDINYSWPTGELAVMGAGGAVNIIHRNQLKDADDPDQLRADLVQDYEDRLINPYVAAERGLIDDVIDPSETRQKVIRALAMLDNKREVLPPKKHGSIPL
ncbi:MAG: acyl-CoA carboxylase subunit beta [SAR202 cluster bacterium]|nr:acyl-CoA carboxylase subunit beta [SAR202 cluster bacterium]